MKFIIKSIICLSEIIGLALIGFVLIILVELI